MPWHLVHSEKDKGSPGGPSWRIAKALVWSMVSGTSAVASTDVPAVAAEVWRRLEPLPIPLTEPEIIAQIYDLIVDVVADRLADQSQ
jgi:hypothetical protein